MKCMLDLTHKDVELIAHALLEEHKRCLLKDKKVSGDIAKIFNQFLDLMNEDLPFYVLKMDMDSWIRPEDLPL